MFRNEAGGHRIQRIPPTERKGRVHSSTVTVAVLAAPPEVRLVIPDKDLDWKACRGSGAGGQHRNVTNSAITVTHLPTGLTVRCESERSAHQNKAVALACLRARLFEAQETKAVAARTQARKDMVGSGMRGDKRWTLRFQDDVAVDHETNRKLSLKDYMRGIW